MPKVIDLFSGCGGLTLGFQNAGFEVVAAADNWQPAVNVYKLNFDHDMLDLDLGDVKKSVAALKKYKADIVVGGPPCQDFSQAGKRNENGGRGDLTVSFAEIIEGLKPKVFVMENVDMLTKSSQYKKAMKVFKRAGYGITEKLLDASFCGVPQKRKRHFVIGILKGKDNEVLDLIEKNLLSEPMSIRDYLGNSLGLESYYRHPRNYNRRGVFSIDEPSPTVRGVNRPIPKGYKPHKNDAAPISKVRPLTTIERSYIQTFPKNFVWSGGKSDLEQLIGNAVPVKLAEYVASCLAEHLGVRPDKKKSRVRVSRTLFEMV
jgi:DNA (cytosine-5)-methyltransferase 1